MLDMHPLQEDVGKEDISDRLGQVRTQYTALKPLDMKGTEFNMLHKRYRVQSTEF